jgi:hypothetical protein
VDYRALAGQQPHRRWLPESHRSDERAGSTLGSLNILYRTSVLPNANKPGVTDEQHEAGRRYAVIVGAYRAMIGAPRGDGGSGRGYACRGEEGCYPCLCLARQKNYSNAYEALAEAGRPAVMAVNAVAVHDQRADLDSLRAGLTALARHFGLRS